MPEEFTSKYQQLTSKNFAGFTSKSATYQHAFMFSNLIKFGVDTFWELIRFRTLWPNFQSNLGSEGCKPKPFFCTQYSPNFWSIFDEILRDYALVVSDELIGFWPNFQSHWGQISQICGIWLKPKLRVIFITDKDINFGKTNELRHVIWSRIHKFPLFLPEKGDPCAWCISVEKKYSMVGG